MRGRRSKGQRSAKPTRPNGQDITGTGKIENANQGHSGELLTSTANPMRDPIFSEMWERYQDQKASRTLSQNAEDYGEGSNLQSVPIFSGALDRLRNPTVSQKWNKKVQKSQPTEHRELKGPSTLLSTSSPSLRRNGVLLKGAKSRLTHKSSVPNLSDAFVERTEDGVFDAINETRFRAKLKTVGDHFETARIARSHSKELFEDGDTRLVPDLPRSMRSRVERIPVLGIEKRSLGDMVSAWLGRDGIRRRTVLNPRLRTASIGICGDETEIVVTEIFKFKDEVQ